MVTLIDQSGEQVEGSSVLAALDKSKVISITPNPDGSYLMTEGCYNWYSVTKSRDDLIQLSNELLILIAKNNTKAKT